MPSTRWARATTPAVCPHITRSHSLRRDDRPDPGGVLHGSLSEVGGFECRRPTGLRMNARHRRAQPCPVTSPVRRPAAAARGGRSSASPGRCEAFAQTPSGPRDGSEGGRRSHLRPHFMVDLARITLCATAAAASELPARQADADGGDLAVNSVVLSHLLRPVGSAVARISTSGERLRAQQSALGTAERRRSSRQLGSAGRLGRRLAEVDDALQPHPEAGHRPSPRPPPDPGGSLVAPRPRPQRNQSGCGDCCD